MVGVVRALTEGMAYQITVGGIKAWSPSGTTMRQTTVGGVMNTSVALTQSSQVGIHKSLRVGKGYDVSVGENVTSPVTDTDPLGLEVLPGPFPLPIPWPKSPAQQEADANAAKALTKWWHDTFSEEDECPPCSPPAGEKYNIEIHIERHEGRGLAHGCMVLTGNPVHWHYDVSNQNPKTCKCYPQKHEFGGCGLP